MNTNSIDFQSQTLQKIVISLLGRIGLLIDEACRLAGSQETTLNYKRFHQELIKAARNVEELRLKIAIAAPTKTNKSAIINAIIGQPLLPSCNTAMTILPTEILLNPQLYEPVLTLTPKTLFILKATLEKLQQEIRTLQEETLQKKISSYPHLLNLARCLAQPIQFTLSEKVLGCEAINQTLTDLNDLIRLCSLILPEANPLSNLTEFPLIETPFWGLQQPNKTQTMSHLLIVDIPQLDEVGDHGLTEWVTEQLENSLIVLMVLDLRQLEISVSEQVKQDIKKIMEVRKNENLYILLDKVDQQRYGNLTFEGLQELILEEIDGESYYQQLFEISTRQAFVSAHFIQEVEKFSNIALETAVYLAEEIFGNCWEEKLEETTLQELKILSQELWEQSGFPQFLNTVIHHRIENSAFFSIQSALKLSQKSLTVLLKDRDLQNSPITKIAEALSHKIPSIYEILLILEIWQECLQHIDRIAPSINESIDQDAQQLKFEITSLFKDYFRDQEYKYSSDIGKLLYTPIFQNSSQSQNNYEYEKGRFFKFKPSGKIQFKTVEDAKNCSELAQNYLKTQVKIFLKIQEAKTIQYFTETQNFITEFLNENIKQLTENSQNWFHDNRTKILACPQISFEIAERFKLIQPSPIKKIKVKKNKPDLWYEKILVSLNHLPQSQYEVSFQSLNQINHLSIDASFQKMKRKTSKYIENQFKNQINYLFKSYIDYLRYNRVNL